MDNYIIPKLQFEVRFHHILDFNRIIRTYLNPFLKFTQSFNIQSDGTMNDILVLNFEEGFHIDCRWDRFVLVSDGSLNNFNKETSAPIAMFYDVFDKFSKLDSFVGITNRLILINYLEINELTLEDTVELYYKKAIKLPKEIYLEKWNDISITFEYADNDEEIAINTGPFSSRDIFNRGLFKYNNENREKAKDKFGFLMEYKHFKRERIVNYKSFEDDLQLSATKFKTFLNSLK